MEKTRILMIATAIACAAMALLASFAPALLLEPMDIPVNASSELLLKLLAALYFGFAMLNWTAKSNMIGGIYSRPVSVGNFIHFMVGSLALLKLQLDLESMIAPLAAALAIYLLFTAAFGWLVFGFGGACSVASEEQ